VFSGCALSVAFGFAPLYRDSPGATGGTTPPRNLGVHFNPRAAQVKSRVWTVAGQVHNVVVAYRVGFITSRYRDASRSYQDRLPIDLPHTGKYGPPRFGA
jgi:hypothetical protein